MFSTVLFDLDGTLLGMDNSDFEKKYFSLLAKKFIDYNRPEELIDMIWDSTKYMIEKKDNNKVNEEKFFERFNTLIKPEYKDIYYNTFLEFYNNEFELAKKATFRIKNMIDAVNILKKKGYDVLIATNPLFPEIAIHKRIYWAGFKPEDFSYITSFEVCRYCKPHIEFYEDIIKATNKAADECLMVGNDMQEDMIAKKIGISTYLVDDCIIERDIDIEPDYRSRSKGFLSFVENLPII